MLDLLAIKSALADKCHEGIAQMLREALEAAGLEQEDIQRVCDFMSGKVDLP
jgi:alkylhydroperoxidase/carboxymuconolactone decarboxylase family protein YurZ